MEAAEHIFYFEFTVCQFFEHRQNLPARPRNKNRQTLVFERRLISMDERQETPLDKARREFQERNAGKNFREIDAEIQAKQAAAVNQEEKKTEETDAEKKAAPKKRRTLAEREKALAERRDALNKELQELRAEIGKKERRERNHLLILFGAYFEEEIKKVAKWESREKNDEAVKKLAAEIKAKLSP